MKLTYASTREKVVAVVAESYDWIRAHPITTVVIVLVVGLIFSPIFV